MGPLGYTNTLCAPTHSTHTAIQVSWSNQQITDVPQWQTALSQNITYKRLNVSLLIDVWLLELEWQTVYFTLCWLEKGFPIKMLTSSKLNESLHQTQNGSKQPITKAKPTIKREQTHANYHHKYSLWLWYISQHKLRAEKTLNISFHLGKHVLWHVCPTLLHSTVPTQKHQSKRVSAAVI